MSEEETDTPKRSDKKNNSVVVEKTDWRYKPTTIGIILLSLSLLLFLFFSWFGWIKNPMLYVYIGLGILILFGVSYLVYKVYKLYSIEEKTDSIQDIYIPQVRDEAIDKTRREFYDAVEFEWDKLKTVGNGLNKNIMYVLKIKSIDYSDSYAHIENLNYRARNVRLKNPEDEDITRTINDLATERPKSVRIVKKRVDPISGVEYTEVESVKDDDSEEGDI